MARTPKTTTAPAEAPMLNESALATLGAAPAQLSATQEAMTEMLDLGRRLGQMETASFFSNICDEVLLSSFESAKKSKAWRLLKDNKNQIFESFDEFCRQRFGYSYARLQQVSVNRSLIGQEAFEQAERLGLRQKDYNAIKALPAPDKELVRRAVEEATTREQVLDVLHDLAARGAQEKAALREEKASLQEQLQDARDQAEELAASKKVVESTVADLRKQARRLAQAAPDEVAAHLRTQAQEVAQDMEARILGPLRDGLEQLMTHGEEAGQDQRAWVAGQLELLQDRLKTVAGRMGIELAGTSSMPGWLNPSAIPTATANSAD